MASVLRSSAGDAIRLIGFLLSAAVFLVLGMLAARSFQTFVANNDWVEHTLSVLNRLERLESLLKDAETGDRGFIITGEPQFLEPYSTAVAQLPAVLADLRTLTTDNIDQQRALDALEPVIAEKLRIIASAIAARRENAPEAELIATIHFGKAAMDEARQRILAMTDEENRLYRLRAAAVEAQMKVTVAELGAGGLLGIAILALVFFLMVHEVRVRRQAERSLRAVNASLEDRVLERTAALARANQDLNAIIHVSPLGIFMLDAAGKVVLWNQSTERLFGYSEAEAIGKLPPYLIPDHLPDFHANIGRALHGAAASGALETVRRRKDGKEIDVRANWALVEREDGSPRSIMYLIEDITDRKNLDQQLRQAQKMDAIGRLTGGIAHDFNNLLGIIVGSLDLLTERVSGDADSAELTQEALDGAIRGAELTQRLLAFARRQPLEPKIIGINELLPRAESLLQRTLGETIEVKTLPGRDLWPATADPSQVEEAVLNLAINARDAMPGGGQLLIETANVHLDEHYAALHAEVTPGDYVMLSVADTGAGMPPDIVERAFEPFFTTKPTGKGTGLGLSMIYGFIKQSNGHVKIYSELGHGTMIKMYLPRSAEAAAQEPSVTPLEHPTGRETILVVEDDPRLRRVAVKILAELGYLLREAENAAIALQSLQRDPEIDLLFSDIVMPGGMDGYDLARAAVELRPGLKVLLTSGYSEAFVANGHSESRAQLLSKPYRKHDLARKIRAVLDGPRET